VEKVSVTKTHILRRREKLYYVYPQGLCVYPVIYILLIRLLQLSVQSVPITANVVSTNPAHGEVYSIQHYAIKFVSDSWQVSGFLRVSSTNKTDHHDIAEILLKVALKTKLLLHNKHIILEIYRSNMNAQIFF